MIYTVFTEDNAMDFASYREAKAYAENLGESYTIEATEGEVV